MRESQFFYKSEMVFNHKLQPHKKRLSINIEDRILTDKCYPQYKWHAKTLIESYLNFYPDEPICLPYEPMLQSLIAGYKSGRIDEEEFANKAEFFCRQIRNETMWQFEEIYKLNYDDNDLEIYHSYLPHYKIAARERLCDLLDSEPDLQLSLYGELFIRELMREDTFYNSMDDTWHDNLAMNIVWYRWALRKNNCVLEANESFLLGDAISKMCNMKTYYFLQINK